MMMNHLSNTCLLLAICFGLIGCSSTPTYHIESHEAFLDAQPEHEGPLPMRQFPTLTMVQGESFVAVEPAQGIGPTGYWKAIWVEDTSVARAEPLDSYFEGTILTAIAPGKTKAYYGNAATFPRGQANAGPPSGVKVDDWFWIEVLAPEAGTSGQ